MRENGGKSEGNVRKTEGMYEGKWRGNGGKSVREKGVESVTGKRREDVRERRENGGKRVAGKERERRDQCGGKMERKWRKKRYRKMKGKCKGKEGKWREKCGREMGGTAEGTEGDGGEPQGRFICVKGGKAGTSVASNVRVRRREKGRERGGKMVRNSDRPSGAGSKARYDL